MSTTTGRAHRASEVGWSGFGVSVPFVLLGRGGVLAFLVLWTFGPYIPLDSLRDMLTLALVPMAVIFGFGLKRFEEIGDLLRARPSLGADATRGRFLQVVLVYGGSVTALTAVLVYSLIPEFELPDTFPPDLVALDPYRLITLGVATLVLLPVVLIVRYPFLTLGSKRLTTAVDRPSMNGHWKQRRKARYWDTSVVLALFFLDIAVLALLGGWLPEDAYLVELALVGLLYEAVCALFKGCTVGKWRHRVRVVGLDDNPVSRRRALGRATVLYAPLLSFGLLQLEAVPAPNAAVLWALTLVLYGLGTAHPYGRGFHDLVAGTRITTPSDPPTEAQPSEAAIDAAPVRGLRLPRPELEATPEDPFVQDKLNRQPHVKALCHWIEVWGGHPVVMIDAGWGAGKTAFMTMCHAYLKSRDKQVVAYNAWRASYTQQPLFDLVAAVATQLPGPHTEAMAKSAAKVSSVRSIWAEVRSSDTTEPVDLSELPAETYRAVAEFQEKLKVVTVAAVGPLVVLIDELDRCRPTYAVETLEVVRHLFTVDGVVVVVAANRKQLVEAVKGMYGEGFGADRYLDRFVDLSTPLRTPDRDTRAPFLTGLASETGLATQSVSDKWCQSVLDMVAGLPRFELRDAEHAAHLAAVTLSSNPPPHVERALWERYVLALVLLRIADKKAYSQFVGGDIDSFTAVGAINGATPPTPEGNSFASTRYEIAAALIHIGSAENPWTTGQSASNLFMSKYQHVIASRAGEAKHVWEHLHRSYPACPPIQASQVAALMDLAVYDPAGPSDGT